MQEVDSEAPQRVSFGLAGLSGSHRGSGLELRGGFAVNTKALTPLGRWFRVLGLGWGRGISPGFTGFRAL